MDDTCPNQNVGAAVYGHRIKENETQRQWQPRRRLLNNGDDDNDDDRRLPTRDAKSQHKTNKQTRTTELELVWRHMYFTFIINAIVVVVVVVVVLVDVVVATTSKDTQ